MRKSYFLLMWFFSWWGSALWATNEYFLAPKLRFGFRVDDTTIVLSQVLKSDGTFSPGSTDPNANTNSGRKLGLSLLSQFEVGLFRFSLDSKFYNLSSFYYTTAGVERTSLTTNVAAFELDPGVAVKLGPLALGVEFRGNLPLSLTGQLSEAEFYDHRFRNSLSLKAHLDQKIFTLPLYLIGAATFNRNFLISDSFYHLIVDGGLRFDLNYYISLGAKYRFYLGVYDGLQYLSLWFNYQFTPQFGMGVSYVNAMPIAGFHPMRQFQLMATFSPDDVTRKSPHGSEP